MPISLSGAYYFINQFRRKKAPIGPASVHNKIFEWVAGPCKLDKFTSHLLIGLSCVHFIMVWHIYVNNS